jgi:diketogulonate reductase-like aldo/keto reductase
MTWSRRQVLGAGLALLAWPGSSAGQGLGKPRDTKQAASQILLRTIPSSGKKVPAIGLGSARTFDTDNVAAVTPVVHRFLKLGGRVIDTSPMYGRAEAMIGHARRVIYGTAPGLIPPFLATKVWTTGKKEGIAQMKQSLSLLGVEKLDLMQIHNLVDWETQLATLREWKDAGTIRYIGITHYSLDAFDQLERIIRTEKVDFVQLPYSVGYRAAERRLLPAAAHHGVAVLVMEPFAKGKLLQRLGGKRLPTVAMDLGCTSWAQLLLKWILGHPAVTCPIPATRKVKHVEDNLRALVGPVPTEAQRKQIREAVTS